MTAEAEARQEPPPPPRTSSATLGSGREDSGDGRPEQQPLTKQPEQSRGPRGGAGGRRGWRLQPRGEDSSAQSPGAPG